MKMSSGSEVAHDSSTKSHYCRLARKKNLRWSDKDASHVAVAVISFCNAAYGESSGRRLGGERWESHAR